MAEPISDILSRTKIFDSMTAANGLHKEAHKVKIVQNTGLLDISETNNAVIEGYLKEPINFDLSAQWERKEGFVSNLLSSELANTVLQPAEKVGFGATHAGYVTKKYYTGGTDITFNISMRIADVNGKGEVLNAIGKLSALMLPSQIPIGEGDGNLSIAGMFPDQTKKMTQAAADLEDKHASGTGIASTVAQSRVLSSAIAETTEAGITATASPTPVAVFVGEYLHHEDMVITGCNVSFSKELIEIRKVTEATTTDGGSEENVQIYSAPLYVDVNLTVTSRENLYITKGKNEAKGAYINKMYWGYDARTQLTSQTTDESGPTGESGDAGGTGGESQ